MPRKKLLVGINDLKTMHPDLIKEWDWEKNLEYKPDKLLPGAKKKVWWKCEKCGYSWQAFIYNRTKKDNPTGCPVCSGRMGTPLSDTLLAEWNYEKNVEINPTQITASSPKRVWWKCANEHEWLMTVKARTEGGKCPFCSKKILSVAFPELVKELHPTRNGVLNPDDIFTSSKMKAWWLGKCGHEWQATISDRTLKHAGCPYCSGNKVLKGFNDLETVAPDLAAEWNLDKNAGKKASDYSKASTYNAWWLGKCGHEWQAKVYSRVNGSGCPICAKRQQSSFPEQALFFYAKKIDKDVVNGYTEIFDNKMELDILIPSLKVGIEYDGYAWHNSKDSKRREGIKYEICRKNGIKLIRVRECEDDLIDRDIYADEVVFIRKSPSDDEISKT